MKIYKAAGINVIRPLFVGVLAVALFSFSSGVIAAEDEPILRPPPKPAKAARSAGIAKPDKIYYEGTHVGSMQTHVAKYEDTLIDIARRYDIGFVELRAANPDVDPWLPGDKTKLTIPAMHILPEGPRQGIVINLPEMRLYAYLKPGQPPLSAPLGIGRDGLETPTGTTSIVNKREKPIWRPTARMRKEDPTLPEVVPAGPENPLGDYIMYLGWPEYGIHGTNKPYGVGRRVSSGCIRMYPEDVSRLYPMAPVGTPVTVVDQPVKVAWIGDELYVEAHASLAQASKIENEGGLPHYEMSDEDMAAIVRTAGDYAHMVDWATVRRLIRERPGYPVVVARRPPDPGKRS
ncbi:MAG: L,D-transpeptidase family protein [Micavibrio aeruginosavorus]|uniref:L,D-transpeptidase family protein n=1 Tax=Micavibrio aeruginosavorus TaxID=349221 RepID=A0A7T5R3A9_9BACT|nr:MAG: L,D-transpeptidase family protein [Micavibrio aeruginosavorus]